MGTISDKLMRIINTKEDIRQALISKGYDVPTSIPFKEYAKMISDLPCRVDSFPDIEGIVARYSALGLTNEQMAANPVWVDKTGNGHDLQMKNLAWGGMSGVGGYKLNWSDSNTWANYIVQGVYGTGEVTDNTIHITNAKTYNALFETKTSLKSVEYKVLIKGLTDDIYLRYGVFNDGKELWTEIKNDGIYTLPSYDYDSRYNMKWKVMSQTYPIDCNITIEQLPLYPGALVFDGVDDYGICDNFPVLTKEKGYTVVALRQYLFNATDKIRSLVTNAPSSIVSRSTLTFELIGSNGKKTNISFGRGNLVSDFEPNVFSYMTSKSYNGKTITPGDVTESNKRILVGNFSENGEYGSNVAIWELVFLDHDATEEELTKIKDYFVKTYPWLFPDQAWTVVGKTNEDEDRATIANITGNGNNLVLSNFGFAEGSGYGLYAENYAGGRWVQSTDRTDLTWTSYSVNITSVKVASTQLYYQSYPEQPSFTVPSYKIKVYGLKDGQTLSYKQVTSEGQQIYKISEDGTYTLPSFPFKANGDWYGFTLNKVQESCDITIEQIPEYEGYLVTDGVDDKIVSSVFVMGKDFTIVGDWKFIDNKNSGTGLVKGSSFYIYNAMIGLYLFINSGSVKNSLDGIKSINAACSDGRAYDRNWNEILVNTGNVVGSGGMLEVSSSGGRFDRIAFKNLAIYPRILSKDDCIKAYNYLQTLKSK